MANSPRSSEILSDNSHVRAKSSGVCIRRSAENDRGASPTEGARAARTSPRRHLPEPPQPRAPEPSRPFIGRGRRPPFVAGLVLVAKPRTSSTVSPAGFDIHAPAPVTVAVGGIGLVGTAPPAPPGRSIRIAPRLDRLAQVPTAQGSLESLVKPMRRPSAPFDAAPHGASNANANARQLARIPPPGAGCGILRTSFASSRVRACAWHVGRSQVRHGRG